MRRPKGRWLVGDGGNGAASFDALLGEEQTREELVWRKRRLGVVDGLGKVVVVGIETLNKVAGELLITQRSTNGGQCIRQDLDFVEVCCGR